MELWLSCAIGFLVFCGIYLLLRARTFPVALGLTLLSYAINLFLFSMGRLHTGMPAVIGSAADYTDPVPQALVLTAIVIGFAMTAFVLVLALRAHVLLGSDHVDGHEKKTEEGA
ncbi:Na+/H+ antiporter subunit C [Thiopseudomonas denitrificans]|uniref:Multisubunit potassium/proton antiporter PhaC subunit n=1 Tax=Thiopseudomonas denitrificans TaxID=1501432 RepID=A0A4R6UAB2_9GAMM|nr:Na+/H+ antiporter subunit C [Thiopseudomonas denitrificans]TDQ40014.1 multisubunit potassium/proton antiporter PhaC subunit [Thiopseudomonas denitrificans]